MRFNVKRYFQVLGISLSVILILALGAVGMNYFGIPFSSGGNNNTVAGSDDELPDENINVLLLGTDVEQLRTDAMMVVSYNPKTNDIHMLSIPRDTRMHIGSRYQKINAAHAIGSMQGYENMAGAEGSMEAVMRLTGIPINYYIEFSFYAIESIMDAIGPVHFTIPDLYGDGVGMVYDDPVQDLHINLPPGEYDLTGEQVVQLLRYRKGNVPDGGGVRDGYPDGDRGRIKMQQEFLKALTDQKLNASLILKIPAIFKSVSENIKTNLTVTDILKYSRYLANFSSENIHTYTLPGHDSEPGEVKDSSDSFWIPDMDAIAELVEGTFGYDASDITIEDRGETKATPAPVGSGKRVPTSTSTPAPATPTPSARPKTTEAYEDREGAADN